MKPSLLLAALSLAGCAGGSATQSSTPPVPEAPLNAFAATRMIVLPTQAVRTGDTMGWSAKTGGRTFLAVVDSALEQSVKERGLTSWVMPTDLARTARRNPMYAVNPADVRAGDAVRYLERTRDGEIPEPVASQLRTLCGFHDARYALIPVEVRFEPGSATGSGRAVLRVAVLDVRGSRLAFIGDIAGAEVPDFNQTMSAQLAQRFTDLVVPR